MTVQCYNQSGEKTEQLNLDEKVFGLPWNGDLVHQVAVSMQANQRIPIAHAKTRGEVRGGGKKPWRQKGTGRARHGSRRSPIWIGGGVTHGPLKEKNYKKKINKKMKQKALRVVLSQKFRDNEILFLDKLILGEVKTKAAAAVAETLRKIKGFEKLAKKNGKAVIAFSKKTKEEFLSFRNLPYLEVMEARNLNALNLLFYKYAIITKEGVEKMQTWQS